MQISHPRPTNKNYKFSNSGLGPANMSFYSRVILMQREQDNHSPTVLRRVTPPQTNSAYGTENLAFPNPRILEWAIESPLQKGQNHPNPNLTTEANTKQLIPGYQAWYKSLHILLAHNNPRQQVP
jgi:hypothetical protein